MNIEEYKTLYCQYDESSRSFCIVINREKKLNALNSEVLSELKSVLQFISLEENLKSISGVILTGAGEKAFIAGADISEMASMNSQEAYEFGRLGQSVTEMLEDLPVVAIACVNGFALGGGCEFAMACDFIYSTSNAMFGQPEVKLGLIPGFGGTQRLAKYIGRQFAKELIYTGRNLKSDEAKERGLVSEVFSSRNEMMENAKKVIVEISKNSPKAVALSKQVINSGCDLPTKDGLTKELDSFSKIFNSQEMKEGTTAFLEKRAPNFHSKNE